MRGPLLSLPVALATDYPPIQAGSGIHSGEFSIRERGDKLGDVRSVDNRGSGLRCRVVGLGLAF